MKKLFLGTFIATCFILLSGCSAVSMVKAKSQTISPPAFGKAKVVFMRYSHVAGAIGVELFDVTGGRIKFFGSLPLSSKVAYETTPGKKVFMTNGAAADFMIANLKAGKTYYVIVRPNWGTGGFAPTPIRTDGSTEYHTRIPEFKEWVEGTELVIPGESLRKWFNADKQKEIRDRYNDYWARFQNKTPAEVALRTMNPSDGM